MAPKPLTFLWQGISALLCLAAAAIWGNMSAEPLVLVWLLGAVFMGVSAVKSYRNYKRS